MQNNVIRVFHLEDNVGDARLVREMLADINLAAGDSPRIDLDQATRLGQALEILQQETFDLALIDLNLPDSQGLDTLARILRAAPELPVIVMSGMEDYSLALAAVSAGAQDYLVKGLITDSALARVIRYTFMRAQPAKTARPLTSDQAEGQPKRELKSRIPWIGWLVDFFLPPMRNWPLAARLVVITLLIVAGSVMATTMLAVQRQKQSFQHNLERQAEALLDTMSNLLADALYQLDTSQMNDALEAVRDNTDVILTGRVYDRNGRIVADSQNNALALLLQTDPFGQRVLATDTAIFDWQSDHLLAGKAVIIGNQVLGAISIELPTSELETQIAAARGQGLFIAFLMTVLAGLMALWFSRSLTQPLREMAAASRRISDGDLTAEIPVRSADELGILATAFNAMATQLRNLFHTLDQRVIERTRDVYMAEEKYRTLVEQMPVVIYRDLADELGTNTYISPQVEDLLGYSLTEWAQDPNLWQKLVHPEDLEYAVATISKVIHQGYSEAEYRLLSRDGRILWVSNKSVLVHDAEGQPLFIQGTLENITERKHLEEVISENERRYRNLFEQVHDAVFILDLQGQHQTTNQRAADMLGYTLDELMGLSFKDISAQVPQSEQIMQRLFRGEVIPPYERIFRKKNGELFPVEISAELARDTQGNPKHIQSVVRDISERKKAEEKLARHAENMETLSQISHQILTTLEVDRVYTEIHAATQKLMPCDTFVIAILDETNQEIEDVYYWDGGKRYPGGRYPLGQGLTAYIIRSEKPLRVNQWDESYDRMTNAIKFGDTDMEPKSVLAIPLLYGNGKCFGMISAQSYKPDDYTIEHEQLLITLAVQLARAIENARLFTNLREELKRRKQAEEQIRKLSEVVEQSPASIIITDKDANIEYVNSSFEEVTGYSFEEVKGKNPRILKSGEQPQEFYEVLWKTITEGKVWRGVFRDKRKDGSLFWESAIIAPILDRNGVIASFVAIKEDVTTAKEMEQTLHRSYRLQAALNSLLSLSLENESLDELLDRALEAILTTPWLSAQTKGGIFLVGDQPGVLVLKSHRNLGAPLLTMCGRVPFGHCLCGRAAASGRIEHADCVDEQHENRCDGVQPHGHYNIPILFRGEVLGVIVLYLDEGQVRDQYEVEFLEAAANTLAAIIQEKRIEAKLRASENRFRITYETIDDVIYETDYHGILTSVNPSIEKISGYLPQELIGRKIAEFFANPEDYEVLNSVFEAEGAVQDYEIRLKRKGGELAYGSVNAHTLFDAQGKPIGTRCVLRDITDRKNAELRIRRMNKELGRTITERTAELQSSRSFLSTMLETAMAVNASLDQDEVLDQILNQARTILKCRALNVMLIQGEFAYIARRIGYEGMEKIERNLLNLQFPLSWPSFQHMQTTGLSIFIPDTGKEPGWQTAKSSEWARSYIGVPLRVGEETLGFLNASHDQPNYFTENHMAVLEGLAQHASIAIQNAHLLKELETALESERAARSQLVHADKLAALGKMVAVIAHEINNPIQTIKNTFFLLNEHIQPDNPARKFLEIASTETGRIAELVSQLRETYRVRSKTFVRMNLLDLLTEVKTILGPQLKKSNVEWRQPEEFQPGEVFGVRNNLKQVFINLGMNAIEAMEENKGGKLTIELSLDQDGGRVGAAMRNTGPLIPPEALSHIFEPFYTTKKIGTGLGLSISYDIVQQHQGEITVESNPENGVVFTVWLPLAPEEAGKA